MQKETRVYMIEVPENGGSDDYTDKQFMTEAEKQGTVFTLKGFQDHFNYNEWDKENYYIRILNI